MGVPIWAVTAAGLREAALSNSKVEWKQILHSTVLMLLVALGAQEGPLMSGRLPSVAQPHSLTYVGTGYSLLGLRNTFSPSTEVGLLTWCGDTRREAIFLCAQMGRGTKIGLLALVAGASEKTSNTFHCGGWAALHACQALSTNSLSGTTHVPKCPVPPRAPVGTVHRGSVSQRILEDCEEGRS